MIVTVLSIHVRAAPSPRYRPGRRGGTTGGGRWQPRTGDQRSAEGTPAAKPCGSNTATGPSFERLVMVDVRLSGRVLVVITAPGASKMAGMIRW